VVCYSSGMLRRLLNIASIVCLVLCVALMGLWVRSYYVCDMLSRHFNDTQVIGVYSIPGRLAWRRWNVAPPPDPTQRQPADYYFWSLASHRSGYMPSPALPSSGILQQFGFATPALSTQRFDLAFPFWFLVVASGSLAVVLQMRWPPWRFTLRSLFVLTTFLAVVLGMIAWLDRAWIGK
jgi:hypothetical protein